MSFLQTVGIASQRGRQIKRENQQQRTAELQESVARSDLERAAMQDYIYKLVLQKYGQMEAIPNATATSPVAKATGGALAVDPAAAGALQPAAGQSGDVFRDGGYKHGGKVKSKGYANGGMVEGPSKFDGIFDAAQFNGELPDIYKEQLMDAGLNVADPGWTAMVDDSIRRFMDGGMVQQQTQEPPQREKQVDPLVEDRARMAVAGAVRKFSSGGSLQQYDPSGQGISPTMGGGNGMPGGMRPFPGFANGGALGGMIDGPGTGTSDSIPAVINGQEPIRVSDGEFIIPADVVKAKGEEFFNKLIEKYHRRA